MNQLTCTWQNKNDVSRLNMLNTKNINQINQLHLKFNFISQECQAFFEYLSVTIFWGRVADSKCIINKSILFKRTTVKKGEGSWAKTT